MCKEQSFHCHKFVLVGCSEYFATMLKMASSIEVETSNINVNSFPCIVKDLLFFIYGGTMPWKDLIYRKVDGWLYLVLFLELAHLLMVEKVKAKNHPLGYWSFQRPDGLPRTACQRNCVGGPFVLSSTASHSLPL